MRLILLSLFAYGVYSVMQRVIEENSSERVLALPAPEHEPKRRRGRGIKKRAATS